jgi:hypothetical protein
MAAIRGSVISQCHAIRLRWKLYHQITIMLSLSSCLYRGFKVYQVHRLMEEISVETLDRTENYQISYWIYNKYSITVIR